MSFCDFSQTPSLSMVAFKTLPRPADLGWKQRKCG